MEELFAVTFGYLAGSVPFAFLLARRRGVDLRRVGSGNVGAANVLRSTGPGHALAAFGLDAVKGAVAVLVAERLTGGPATPVAAGMASIIGHVYPVWLGFRGGKGVATAAGVFGVLAPVAVAAAGIVFVVVIWATRYISVGSMAAAVTLAVVAIVHDGPSAVSLGAIMTALIVVERHRPNVGRLAAGTERRIGQRIQADRG
jgi:glycerol-3-phosphate acyltransferase PlsY